jgi:hypothetical protein
MVNILEEAHIVLDNLNNWYPDQMDIEECACWYPLLLANGQTGAHIHNAKEQLMDLGFNARWNRERMLYELITIDEDPAPLCECPEVDWRDNLDEAIDILNNLEDWDTQSLDANECPCWYPHQVGTGETEAWISVHREQLLRLRFNVQWNHETMSYELIGDYQDPSPLCRCTE